MKRNILFVGCGKMGTIILKNLLKNHEIASDNFLILKPSDSNKIKGLTYINHQNFIPNNYQADIIFICIKPQNASKILNDLSQLKIFHTNTIFISILAGKNINFFKKIFGQNIQIVRSMPNIAIEVNQGIIPVYFNGVNEENKILAKSFFEKSGLCFEINDEKLFHPITAIFGCGPAYLFLFQEIFENLAKQYSINPDIAHNLIKQLFLGSALLSSKSSQSFSELRATVTSKKGVTEASTKSLIKNNKLQKIISKAFENGIKKSQRLERQ